MAGNVILAINELDGAVSIWLGHALHLAVGSFSSLPDKRRKEAVNRSWGSTNELVSMQNKDYPPLLGVLFKGNIERAVSTYFN